MSDIAIVGDLETIIAFKVIGFDIFPVDKDNFVKNMVEVLKKDYKAIFLIEDFKKLYDEQKEKKIELFQKSVIPLPGRENKESDYMIKLSNLVEKAIGINIFKDEKK